MNSAEIDELRAFAALDVTRPAGDFPLDRWTTLVRDVHAFVVSDLLHRAVVLGWTELDLFGCDPDRPFARVDQAGLLVLLHGDRIAELDVDTATIVTSTSAVQR